MLSAAEGSFSKQDYQEGGVVSLQLKEPVRIEVGMRGRDLEGPSLTPPSSHSLGWCSLRVWSSPEKCLTSEWTVRPPWSALEV